MNGVIDESPTRVIIMYDNSLAIGTSGEFLSDLSPFLC